MCVRCCSRFASSHRRRYLYNVVLFSICFTVYLTFKKTSIKQLSPISTRAVTTYYTQSINQTTLNCAGDPLRKWCENQLQLCTSSLIVYNQLFVLTRTIILQPHYAKGKRIGGENIQDVMNQPEQDEYFRFEKEFIKLPCHVDRLAEKMPKNHLASIFSSLSSYETYPVTHTINETTIAVNRQDYANFYHTITDLYTVYLLCCFFGHDPKSVRILFIDAHPKGNLDILWSQLFHSYNRLGQLKSSSSSSSILYRELIWSQSQPQSEMDVGRDRSVAPSCFFNFHEHVLKQFNIDYKNQEKMNCLSLNIFFLVRRNYVAHPRNPSGKISRQLSNEKQTVNDLKVKFSKYPNINFTSHHFEELSIEEQLNIIARTDIFIGVHGAGLTHVLFMKSHGILVELAPLLWQTQKHFELMASINSVNYRRCSIVDGSQGTAQTIFDCVEEKISQICS